MFCRIGRHAVFTCWSLMAWSGAKAGRKEEKSAAFFCGAYLSYGGS
jgi:hypothetical protein